MFHVHRFNQLQIKNSIFYPWLRIRGWRRPTVCIVLCHFMRDLSSTCGFWYLRGSPLQIPRNDCVKKKKNDIPLHFLLKSALTSSQRKSVKLWNIKRLNDHSLLLISPDICQHLLQCYTTYETSQPETLSHTQPTAASTMAQWPRKKWQLQDMTSGGDTAGLAPQYLCP